jgi:preprotein translocase subunit SecE
MLDRIKNLRTFFGEVRAELRKVTFPARKEVVSTTVVVLIATFIFGFYLFVADLVILRAYQGIFQILGS